MSFLLRPFSFLCQGAHCKAGGARGVFLRRTLLAGAGGAAGWAAFGGISRTASAALRAKSVRVGNHPCFTRVVIDITERVGFSIFSLAEPYRIIVDLPEIEWSVETGLSSWEHGPLC